MIRNAIPQPASAGFYVLTTIHPQIDRMVYDLYGLTDEEIKIVEGSVG